MPGLETGIHVNNFLSLAVFLVVWIVLVRCTHLVIMLICGKPLIGWAIGPRGLTFMVLNEPATWYIWLNVIGPALVSAVILHIGLFTTLSPISFPRHPIVQVAVISCGVLLSSTGDFLAALRDVFHPLWGEARILRHILLLRSARARIHFTPFGSSYVNDHFGASPTELLQAI